MLYWNARSMTDIMDMVDVILTETGYGINKVVKSTRREWMMLLRLYGETSVRMIEADKICDGCG